LKVSIISTNQEKFPQVSIPIGPACIAAALREQGHQVEILDLCFEPQIEEALITHLKSYAPELIGISLRNVDNNELFYLRSFLKDTKGIVETVKKHSQAKIVIGGCGFTLFPEELLRYLELPYGIAGDGEIALPLFIRYLQDEGELGFIPGICYWDDKTVVVNPAAKITDFAGLPFPAYDLLDLQRYLAEVPALPVEGKRGCDLACSFCPEGAKRGIRLRASKLVVDEMEFMAKERGIRRFFFTDGVFNFPPDHALAICQELEERKLDVRWGADINPVAVSRELVIAMKEAGCRNLALGIDTASEKMLRSYRKGFDKEDIVRTAKLLTEAEIRFAYWILFGGPGENLDTAQETIDFLQGVSQPVFFRAGIRVFKGTELERQSREEGILQDNHDMLSPTFYLSKDLGGNFMEWLDRQCEPYENWFTITKMIRQGLVPP
jgi:radical SAM superfamily enzyme YgiQ (UPF0313 family)